MSKYGNHSRHSARHGREGSRRWRLDQQQNKHKSTAARTWEPRLVEEFVDVEGLLAPPEPFKSKLGALRPHPADSWGYRFVPRHPEVPVPASPEPDKGRKKKKKLKPSEKHAREIQPGEPLIDLGAAGLELVPMSDMTVPADEFDDDDDPYSQLLDDAGRMLREYDYVFTKQHPARKTVDADGKRVVIPAREALARECRTPKGTGIADNLKRVTVDVTPALSRAVELMIADGRTKEAREILDRALPDLAKELERIFPHAKVAACGWHVKSGQLHADFWVHSTRLETHILGLKETPTLCRIWEPEGLAHQGPGPGICAWDRHMAALGEEMEELAPARCREVREAIKRQEERASERGRPGTANRDIAIHRKFDEVVASVLPDEYVRRGREAYRAHLLEVYRGGDPKIAKMVADPVRHARQVERMARVLRKTHQEAQAARKAKREAEALVVGLAEQTTGLDRRAVALNDREAKLVSDRELVDLREAAVTQAEVRVVAREAELDWREDQINQAKTAAEDRERSVGRREKSVAASETTLARREADLNVREKTLVAKEQLHTSRVSRFRERVRERLGDLRELRTLRHLARKVRDMIQDLPAEVPATTLGKKLAGLRDWMKTRFGGRRLRPGQPARDDGMPRI